MLFTFPRESEMHFFVCVCLPNPDLPWDKPESSLPPGENRNWKMVERALGARVQAQWNSKCTHLSQARASSLSSLPSSPHPCSDRSLWAGVVKLWDCLWFLGHLVELKKRKRKKRETNKPQNNNKKPTTLLWLFYHNFPPPKQGPKPNSINKCLKITV